VKFNLSCKDVTRLVLEGEDRELAVTERLGVRFHMTICSLCPPFGRQVSLMRQALGRWKQYGGGDDGAPPAG
jgi:hypothetical protein